MTDAPRHILAIEVSNPSAAAGELAANGPGVAVGELSETSSKVEILGVEPVHPGSRGGHDDDLLPAIDRLFRRVGPDQSHRNLARVAVSVGPGGYTSLRVACAAGKMIAEAARARCVSVPTARVVLEGTVTARGEGKTAVALASKGESAWMQVFDADKPEGPGRLMTGADVPDLAGAGVRRLIADRFLPPAMRAGAEAAGLAIIEPVFDAGACARLGASLSAIDPVELVPLYPREPDAVTLWRARKSPPQP